jgi:ATP-binding cassette subfamily B protein
MKTLFKAYKYAFKYDPFLVVMSFINTLCNSVLPFVALYFGGVILNMLVAKNSFEEIMAPTMNLIWLTFILTCMMYVSLRAISAGDLILENKLKEALTEKNLRLDLAIMEKQETKTMLTLAEEGANGSGGFAYFIQTTVPTILKSIIMFVFSCFLLSDGFKATTSSSDDKLFQFFNNPFSFLVIIGEIVLLMFLSFLFMNKINKLSYKLYKDNTKANREYAYIETVIDDYKYAKDFRVYQMKDLMMNLINKETGEIVGHYDSFSKKGSMVNVIITSLFTFLIFSSYVFIGAKAFYGIIPIGSIITIIGSVTNFSSSLSGGLSGISEASIQVKYLSNYFNYLELNESKTKNESIKTTANEIEFKHVYFKYPNTDKFALEDVSFKIPVNKKLAIVGRNGAGKSTIIKLIARFYLPERGEIDLDGVNINNFDFYEYQDKLGILFQDFALFAFTLEENVASLPLNEVNEEKVKNNLDLVAYDYGNTKKLPKGLKTYLYNNIEEGCELSGGEEQKIGIARALYKNSPVILLDEPTSALDPLSEQTVYNSIEKLVKNRTSVFISHRMSSTKFCDNIIVLDKGKVIQEGTHEELMMDKNGIYATMFNEQAKYYI